MDIIKLKNKIKKKYMYELIQDHDSLWFTLKVFFEDEMDYLLADGSFVKKRIFSKEDLYEYISMLKSTDFYLLIKGYEEEFIDALIDVLIKESKAEYDILNCEKIGEDKYKITIVCSDTIPF